MPLLHREATYKDKATARPLLHSTPRARIVVMLVTIVLLVAYSLHTLHQDRPTGLGSVTGGSGVPSSRKEVGHEPTPDSTYHDSDVDFSKHGIDYSKLGLQGGDKRKSTSNDGVDESNIDRSLDSKVVGSIRKGSDKDGPDKAVGNTAAKQTKQMVQADTTRASKGKNLDEPAIKTTGEESLLIETSKKLTPAKPHKVEPEAHIEGDHFKDHLMTDKERLSAQQRAADKPGKVLVEQFENGGVRVLDRINMAS